MIWDSFDAFLHMGGYGLYVWGAYAVTAIGLAIEVVLLGARRRRTLRVLATLHRMENQ